MTRFDKKELIFLLIILALVLISSSGAYHPQNSKNNTNLKNDDQDTILYNVPKVSADEINITSPESKTYYAPMSGYYQATYGFENDEDNTFPSEWIEGGTTTGKTTIIDSKDGHKKVMLINDNDGNRLTPRQEFNTQQSSGTIEFWVYFETNTGGQSTGIRLENSTGAVFVNIYADSTTNDEWVYQNGTTQIFTGLSAINEWFHLSIDFCNDGSNYRGLSHDTYKFTIRRVNGSIYYESPEIYYANFYNIDYAAILSITSWTTTIRATWLDAVGYSWDPNYNIGDNLDEGLLLSFENSTTLDWIGYSLDNQANKTILGNSTIPMPDYGYHTIKVFANNSVGTNYESELRGFTIDYIRIPSDSGGDGDDSTKAEEFDPSMIVIIGLIVVAAAISLVTGRTYAIRKGKIREGPGKFQDYIKHREEVVEDDIVLSKEKHFCLVHKGPIEGHNFICPTCGAYYCIRCFDAIKDLENACWSCGKSLDPSLPIKSLEEEYDIKPITKKESKQDSAAKNKSDTKS